MTEITSLNGTALSPLCFGTMQFGGKADATDSRAMFDACRAAGVTFFDTAHVYTDGASETLLGEFAAAERESLIVATKAAYGGGRGTQKHSRQPGDQPQTDEDGRDRHPVSAPLGR